MNQVILGLDTETTGLDLNKDQIIQFGGIRIDNGQVTKLKFNCKPTVPINPEAQEKHGITMGMLENEKSFSHYAEQLVNMTENALLVGFNIGGFDVPIIDRQLRECGFDDVFKDSHIFDTFELFKKHTPRKLVDAFAFYGLGDLTGAHDALVDVTAAIGIMEKQVEREGKSIIECASMTSLPPHKRIGFSSHIIIDDDGIPIMNFGKWKGKPCDDVEPSFFVWMSKQDFPTEVKKFISKYLG